MDNWDILYFNFIPRIWSCHFVGESEILEANPGGNMAAPLLAEAIGGNILFAFICAVAFATILAVVAGLVLSGASAFAHDIYGQIIKKGQISERQQMLPPAMPH